MKEQLDALLENYKSKEGNIVSLLQDIQEEFGYIPEDVVVWFSKKLEIPSSRFYGIMTFYSQFHMKPRGRNIVTVCSGTACHVKGSEKILNGIRKELKLGENEDTTADNLFTVEKVNCVGACSIAPVTIINKKVRGKSATDKTLKELKSLRSSQVGN